MVNLTKIVTGAADLLGVSTAARELVPFTKEASMRIEQSIKSHADDAAFGSSTLEKVATYTGYIVNSPNQRLLRSDLDSSKALAGSLGGFSNPTKKNVEGTASVPDVTSYLTAGVANKQRALNASIESVFEPAKMKGYLKSYEEFFDEVYDNILSGANTLDENIGKASAKLKVYLKSLADKGSSSFLPKSFDWEKVALNQQEFVNLVRSKMERAGEVDLTPAAVFAKIDAIRKKGTFTDLEDLNVSFIDSELHPFLNNNFKQDVENYLREKSLKEAFLQIPYLKPYIEKDGVYNGIARFIQEDMSDRVNELVRLRDNHASELAGNLKAQEAVIKTYNKKIEALRSDGSRTVAIAQNLIDAISGTADAKLGMFGSDTVKRVSRSLKSLTFLSKMGSNIVTQLPDVARAVVYKIFDKVDMKSLKEPLDFMITLSKEERSMLAYEAQMAVDNGRLMNINDIGNDIAITNSFDRGMTKAAKFYHKYTGVAYFNQFTSNVAARDALSKNLARAQLIVDGKMVKGSFESIEAARFGIDESNAKTFIDEYMTHREFIPEFGLFDPHIERWSSKASLDISAMTTRYVDRVVVQASKGSKWHFANTALGGAVMQFKNWTMGAYEKILMEQLQEAGLSSQHTKLMMANMVAMSSMGAVVGVLKDINNAKEANVTPEALLFHAFDKGGAFAYLDYISSIGDRYGFGVGALLNQRQKSRYLSSSLLEDFLGANFNLVNKQVPDFLGATYRWVSGEARPSDAQKIMKPLPLQNYILLNNAIKSWTNPD